MGHLLTVSRLMPLYISQVDQLFAELKHDMLEGFDSHMAFLKRLDKDDDWSFVIKGQALVEAAVTQAIVAHVGSPELQRIVERLPLADDETGKLKMAKDMNLFSKSQRRFVRKMATLRNHLAHRVDYIDFSFEPYLSSLNAPELQDWRDSIVWFGGDRETTDVWKELAVSSPRSVLFMSIFLIVMDLHIGLVEAGTKRKIDAAALKTAEELFAKGVHLGANG